MNIAFRLTMGVAITYSIYTQHGAPLSIVYILLHLLVLLSASHASEDFPQAHLPAFPEKSSATCNHQVLRNIRDDTP